MDGQAMFHIRTLLWAGLVAMVTAEFSCPSQLVVCKCGKSVEWWDDSWTDVSFVNCTNLMLQEVPDLSSLKGRNFHRLLLNNNNITVLRDHNFRNLSVKEIVLSNNRIRKIPKHTFSGLRNKLEYLYLDRNKIKLDKGLHFLKGLKRLKHLDLGYNLLANKYKEFPGNLFRHLNMSSIETLRLQTLQMSNLMEGTFKGIEHLEQLDLSQNYLPEFPNELKKLKNLKGLKLYSNEILKLKNDTFQNLTNLRQLLVGVNDIRIEIGAFNGLEESIEEINLYHNPLYKVPTEAIQRLRNLKKLSLVKTQMESIENGSFVGEYELEELHLDDNPNLDFSDTGMFHGIEGSLKILHLSRLDRETLPMEVLRRLTNLTRLDATSNRLQTIDEDFFMNLNNLQDILLGWNEIQSVDHRAFEELPNGVILNLNQNDISNISFILEVEECKFEKIMLYGNMIKCDCTLEKVLNSGLISWGIMGNCHAMESSDTWYDFSDPALMDYLKDKCEVTSPYASCVQASPVSGASRISDVISVNLFVYLICLSFILLRFV